MWGRATLIVCAVGILLTGCAQDNSRQGRSDRAAIGSTDGVQTYLSTVRSELRDGKAGLINRVMRLSADESEIFWEIYQEYESEYFALGERRMKLEYELAERIRAGTLDGESSGRIAASFLDLRDEQTALLRRYHQRISSELSPLRGAQFLQIEHRTGTVVDLVVSSEAPIIRAR